MEKTGMKTSTGFEFVIIDETYKTDFAFLKIMRNYANNPMYVIDIAERLLGPEQMEKLEEHCTEGGVCSTIRFINEVEEIVKLDMEAKK